MPWKESKKVDGKLLGLSRKRQAVKYVMDRLSLSERKSCLLIGISRTSFRYQSVISSFKAKIRSRIISLAESFGRYGYRKITYIINREGFKVGKDLVYRIWREEGLKVPSRQPRKKKL